VEADFHACLTSAIDADESSAPIPGTFTPRKRASSTHWLRGYVGPRAGVDAITN